MRSCHLLLIAVVLLSSLGCSGAGSGVAPEELTPLQRWVATKADDMGMTSGYTLVIDAQAGIVRLFHDGVVTQEMPIVDATGDESETTTVTAPSD